MPPRWHKIGLDANLPIIPNGDRAGEPADRLRDPDTIAGTGAAWVRLNFVLGPWASPTDPARFFGRTWAETYGLLVDQYRERGMQVYGLVGHEAVRTPAETLFLESPEATPDRSRAERWIAEYVDNFEAIVAAFQGKVTVFESFNEPDNYPSSLERNWIHPHWFARMLDQVYRQIKVQVGFPGVRLVSGPLQGLYLDERVNQNAAATYLRRAYQYGRQILGWGRDQPYPFDGVGYHLYIHEHYEPDWNRQAELVRATYRQYVDQMLQVIREFEGDAANEKKLYISEIGWHSYHNGSEHLEFQARNMDLSLNLLVKDPAVAVGIWFCTEDFDEANSKFYGLYRQGYIAETGRKPAYDAFRAFCERLNQAAEEESVPPVIVAPAVAEPEPVPAAATAAPTAALPVFEPIPPPPPVAVSPVMTAVPEPEPPVSKPAPVPPANVNIQGKGEKMSTDLSPEEEKAQYGYIALDGIPPSMDAWQLGRVEYPLGSFEQGRYVLVGVEPAWIEMHHQVEVLDENGDPLPGVWVIFGWRGPDINIPTRTNLWHGAPVVLQGNAQRTNRMGYAQHTFREGGEDVWIWDVQDGALKLPSPIVRSCKWIGTEKGAPFIHTGVRLTFQRRRIDVEPRGCWLDRIDAAIETLQAETESLKAAQQAGGGLADLPTRVDALAQVLDEVKLDVTFIKRQLLNS